MDNQLIANNIIGGAGNDMLYGGLGADTLVGNDGHSTFAFTTALNSTVDTIRDFVNGVDKIALAADIFNQR